MVTKNVVPKEKAVKAAARRQLGSGTKVTKKPALAAGKTDAVGKSSAVPKRKRTVYHCSYFKQRKDANAPRFCVFSASASEVLTWSDIERLGPGVEGIQRRENKTKRRQIAKFLENDNINTIPTAVIIAFDDASVRVDEPNGKIEIINAPNGPKHAGLVIDGQHRLLGISDYDPKNARSYCRNFEL